MGIFRRWNPLAPLVLLAVAFLAACGGESSPPATNTTATSASAGFPVTITDSANRQVTIPAPPQRIVVLAPSQVEVLFALGVGDRVVAVEKNTDFPPEAAKLKKIAAYPSPNLEEVTALNPDLVVVSFTPESQKVPEMERLGLRVIFLAAPSTVNGVFEQIEKLGKATGRQAQAQDMVANMKKGIEAITSKLARVGKGPRVFYELDPTLFTAGTQSYIGDMLRLLKAQNVAEGVSGPFPQLSLEVLVQRDPEVILLADSGKYGGETPETVRARPGWGNLSAVKNGRVYEVDPDLVNRPGPRIADGLAMLARFLYPELFR